MTLYYLRIRKTSPQDGEYNPLQKAAYTSVFFILTPLIIASGLAMSPQMDAGFKWLPAIFGGRQSARTFHFLTTFFFAFFTFGHVFMVATTGALNNMRSMITGWYKEKGLRVSEFQGSRVEEKVESQTFDSETLKPLNHETLKPPDPESLQPLNPETLKPETGDTPEEKEDPTDGKK
jgi:cytochrome b subunit of formate dehydrogenase